MLVGRPATAGGPGTAGPLSRSNGRCASSARRRATSSSARPRRPRPRNADLHPRVDPLDGAAVGRREGRPQRGVAVDEALEAPPQRLDVEPAADRRGAGDVVGGARRARAGGGTRATAGRATRGCSAVGRRLAGRGGRRGRPSAPARARRRRAARSSGLAAGWSAARRRRGRPRRRPSARSPSASRARACSAAAPGRAGRVRAGGRRRRGRGSSGRAVRGAPRAGPRARGPGRRCDAGRPRVGRGRSSIASSRRRRPSWPWRNFSVNQSASTTAACVAPEPIRRSRAWNPRSAGSGSRPSSRKAPRPVGRRRHAVPAQGPQLTLRAGRPSARRSWAKASRNWFAAA